MVIDVLTTATGIFSFGVFLLAQVITFRWVRPENLLRSLVLCTVVIMAFPVLLMTLFYFIKPVKAPVEIWIVAAVLASLIQGLLCFFYVLCIFGPYETSVRMRLVREIALGASKGISMQALLERYNNETIVDIRLQRLTGSGDLIEQEGRYRSGRSRNFFFIFYTIAGVIKKWIGR